MNKVPKKPAAAVLPDTGSCCRTGHRWDSPDLTPGVDGEGTACISLCLSLDLCFSSVSPFLLPSRLRYFLSNHKTNVHFQSEWISLVQRSQAFPPCWPKGGVVSSSVYLSEPEVSLVCFQLESHCVTQPGLEPLPQETLNQPPK